RSRIPASDPGPPSASGPPGGAGEPAGPVPRAPPGSALPSGRRSEVGGGGGTDGGRSLPERQLDDERRAGARGVERLQRAAVAEDDPVGDAERAAARPAGGLSAGAGQ